MLIKMHIEMLRKRLAAYLGQEARHFERYSVCYAAIADDGHVVTACWRR